MSTNAKKNGGGTHRFFPLGGGERKESWRSVGTAWVPFKSRGHPAAGRQTTMFVEWRVIVRPGGLSPTCWEVPTPVEKHRRSDVAQPRESARYKSAEARQNFMLLLSTILSVLRASAGTAVSSVL